MKSPQKKQPTTKETLRKRQHGVNVHLNFNELAILDGALEHYVKVVEEQCRTIPEDVEGVLRPTKRLAEKIHEYVERF